MVEIPGSELMVSEGNGHVGLVVDKAIGSVSCAGIRGSGAAISVDAAIIESFWLKEMQGETRGE
ncbi:uncharacterized protein ColSpa_01594 [Colletotrichum spaethianum]|uniref:Uncharacterized protein n=1 Tax=Colletotrichum spaethianum TaxID=700344 RepID=A0AA37L3S1_9PEZI|nr:uncharacterized protein ColSpa_01594 [Colletotrichum spaethianum]GKT41413.1 hypothetical protein ColSpa_01594 [Colletotrichum spaethianum]